MIPLVQIALLVKNVSRPRCLEVPQSWCILWGIKIAEKLNFAAMIPLVPQNCGKTNSSKNDWHQRNCFWGQSNCDSWLLFWALIPLLNFIIDGGCVCIKQIACYVRGGMPPFASRCRLRSEWVCTFTTTASPSIHAPPVRSRVGNSQPVNWWKPVKMFHCCTGETHDWIY